jgi:hypothetical protein
MSPPPAASCSRATALGLAAVTATAGFVLAPAAAQAATGTVYYVDDSTGAGCTDSGPGTEAEPFCTIQPAANAATAGDTVLIEDGYMNQYSQNVTISNSGTATAPITFASTGLPYFITSGGLTVSGSYVDITGAQIQNAEGGPLTVTGSHVTFDRDEIGGEDYPALQTGAGVADLTVTRSFLHSFSAGSMIVLGRQNTGDVISTDVMDPQVSGSAGAAVTVSDDSGTDLTGNTLNGICNAGFQVTGSTGTSIENNVFGEGTSSCAAGSAAIVSVDGASAPSTTEGYNVLDTADGTVAPFSSGYAPQGAEDDQVTGFDMNSDSYAGDTAAEGTADPDAPGELATDIYGSLGQESAYSNPAQPDSNVAWWTSDNAPAPSIGENGPSAVVMNVTVASSQTIGVITAYPTGPGYSRPGVSNLNFAPGEIVPNLVMVAVGPGFGLALYNQSKGATNLVVDYYGYFS